MKKLWHFLTRPSSRYSVAAIAIVGVLIALAGVFSFHETLEYTSSTKFCVSCHSMQENYKEYKLSLHFKNAYGVRAQCQQCHIPEKDPIAFMKAKLGGVTDIYNEFVTGRINTPEKFEANRLRLAEQVWTMMRETNSATCKSCHSYAAMNASEQTPAAAAAMKVAAEKDMNCIDCHKGIVHELPQMAGGFRKTFQTLQANAALAPDDKTLYSLDSKALYSTPDSSSTVEGQLLPASQVTVLERQGDLIKVQITGWMEKNGKGRVLTEYMGKRVFTATVRGGVKATEKVLKTETDATTGMEWNQVTVQAWLTQTDMLSSIKPIWSYAKDMYGASCNSCHAAPDPSHYTANGWISGLKAMSAYYRLNQTEERTLLKYLQNHAKDTGAADQAH